MIWIGAEPPQAASQREALLDRAFGPARFAKTAERLREGRLPAEELSFAALESTAHGDMLVGTLRFWHVRLGEHCDGLLLGPVAVGEPWRGTGLGGRIIRRGLATARALGHRAVILVGDAPYYQRFGFSAAPASRLILPGPVDRHRFLALELSPGAMATAEGPVRASGEPVDRRRAA
ncbi:MAG: N-acetyltransferase [Rhodospirillales bacterium]|nr:N-acetyltransferase [Rhodospirillales bacterium]